MLAKGALAFVKVLDAVQRAWPRIQRTVDQVVDAVSGFLKRNQRDLRTFANTIEAIVQTVVAIFRSIWPAVRQTLQGLVQGLRGIVRTIAGILRGDLGDVLGGLKDTFGGAFKAVLGVMRGYITPFRKVGAAIGGGIASGVKSGVGAIVGFVKGVLNAVIDVINGLIGDVNSVTRPRDLGPLGHTPGVRLPSVPHVATGAVIRGRYSDGDKYPVMVAGEEVVLNPRQQSMIGRGRIMDVLRSTGAQVLGAGSRAMGGGLAAMASKASEIDRHHYQYAWGGGHRSLGQPSMGTLHKAGGPIGLGYDCSGAVSAVLGAAGVVNRPMVSGELANDNSLPRGPGRVTIYANAGHTFMRIAGRYFGTSGSNPNGGAGWFPGMGSAGYTVRHVPEDLLQGGGLGAAAGGWKSCLLTWYKPSAGGINGRSGGGAWAGHPVYDTTWGCAAPPEYKFGTQITFRYRGKVVSVPVVDRGGVITGRHFDLLPEPARKLGITGAGRVKAEFVIGGQSDNARVTARPTPPDDQADAGRRWQGHRRSRQRPGRLHGAPVLLLGVVRLKRRQLRRRHRRLGGLGLAGRHDQRRRHRHRCGQRRV
jgi:hypothetical protein